MTNKMITPPLNELAARYALASAIMTANADAAATIANRFARFSDDDLDYLPASLNIASTCAAYIEPILISFIPSTACLDAIMTELPLDDDFLLDCTTSDASYLALFLPRPSDDRDEPISTADSLQNDMLIAAYNDAFAALELSLDADLDLLPADFESTLTATFLNINNAFHNAHRIAYPNSYPAFYALHPTSITLDSNPYLTDK